MNGWSSMWILSNSYQSLLPSSHPVLAPQLLLLTLPRRGAGIRCEDTGTDTTHVCQMAHFVSIQPHFEILPITYSTLHICLTCQACNVLVCYHLVWGFAQVVWCAFSGCYVCLFFYLHILKRRYTVYLKMCRRSVKFIRDKEAMGDKTVKEMWEK